jgi:dipicolinate synthase subunit A
MHQKWIVLGGDERQRFMLCRLTQAGLSVQKAETLPPCADAYGIILPLPVSADQTRIKGTDIGLSSFADAVSPRYVFGGKLPEKMRNALTQKGVRCFDYAARDEFGRKNAVPTAHGTLLYVMEQSKRTLCGQRVVVIGYGVCGKAVSRVFHAMGAKVTAAARRYASAAEAQADGYDAVLLRSLPDVLPNADVVINTVPSRVLGEREIDCMRSDVLLADIASFPYGVDAAYASAVGKEVHLLPSIPGRYFPETAGIIIAETVLHIMEEEGLQIP